MDILWYSHQLIPTYFMLSASKARRSDEAWRLQRWEWPETVDPHLYPSFVEPGTKRHRCFPRFVAKTKVTMVLWFSQKSQFQHLTTWFCMVHQPLRSETSLDLAPPSTRQSAILLVSSPVFVKFTMGTTKRDWHHIWCHILTNSINFSCLDMLNRSIPHVLNTRMKTAKSPSNAILLGGLEHFWCSISYLGCHPSHWLSYCFRGVGQPPTRCVW